VDRLPNGSLLVRTWFGDDAAWERLKAAVATPSEEGFLADVRPIDDRLLEGLDPEQLAARTPHGNYGAIVSFLADETTLSTADQPILVVRVLPSLTDEEEFPSFRVIPSELWSVENNLNLANMDWIDFYRAAGPDGVYRGF